MTLITFAIVSVALKLLIEEYNRVPVRMKSSNFIQMRSVFMPALTA